MRNTEFKVVGLENDGALIFESMDGTRYTSGETREDFGENNLFEDEIALLDRLKTERMLQG